MGNLGNSDWWLFVYSPSMLFAAAFFFGWRRWAVKEKLFNILPMICMSLLGFLGLFPDLFSIDSFFHFSLVYFICFWVLLANLNIPGIVLFASGGILNSVAALMNGGKMPVLDLLVETRFHQPMNADVRFRWLCDFITTPNGTYLMSPGDFLLVVGAVVFFMQEMRMFLDERMAAKK